MQQHISGEAAAPPDRPARGPRRAAPPSAARRADTGAATRSLWGDAWRQFRRHRLALAGLAALGLIALATLLGPLLYRVPPNSVDFAAASQGPSQAHPFGTNDLGQDVLARTLAGGRISVAVGLVAMLVSIGLGTLVGALAGFFGGALDALLMRLTDVFLALPQLPLLLLIIFLFREPVARWLGPELGVFALVVLVIGGLNWMALARMVRASFLSLREAEFVLAARASGVPPRRIMARHILPNALGPVIVSATLSVGAAILTESSLSFPPDTPTWGRMLFEAQSFIEVTPSVALFPGLCIFLTVLSVNAIGDALRDALDPQLRGR